MLSIQFTGANFVYDNIPTEHHGLIITDINGGGEAAFAGTQSTPITTSVFRNPVRKILAVDQSAPLTFQVEITSRKAKDSFELAAIANWLTEQSDYKMLQIDQKDLKNAYFNCIFTNMSPIYYHNKAYSFRCTIECDAPWAWEWEKTHRWNFSDSSINTKEIFNTSGSRNLIKPKVEFQLAGSNTSFQIINKSLNNLTMAFSGLMVGERIFVDCRTFEIKSISRPDVYIVDKFNKIFFALRQGKNELEFRGVVDELTIKYQHALKVGG